MEDATKDLFDKLKEQLCVLDPVHFAEKYLTLDGKPFRISGNGYKPFADIYRYIGVKALEPTSKPIVLVKGRQVGGTTMACALEMYFMGSGLFGVGDKPPIRVIHAFPLLELAAAYSKTKLNQMMSSSLILEDEKTKKIGKTKSYMQSLLDQTSPTNDSLHFKQFVGGNHIWVESTGIDADRLMGRMLALDTEIPTPNGFIKLIDLKEGDQLFDENGNICNVIKLHPIDLNPESYRIFFDDDSYIDACAEHLWLTYTEEDRNNLNNKPTIKSTKEILNTLYVNNTFNHSIPVCKPINYSKKSLSLDPYLRGLSLKNNIFSYKYIYSSFEDRLALLQGLMDNQGSINEFKHSNKKIIDQVYELITSLGIKAKISKEHQYIIKFNTNLSISRLNKDEISDSEEILNHRFISKIESIPSVSMRCITVDSPNNLFLVSKSYISTHNTADVLMFDECIWGNQRISTNQGNIKISKLYNMFASKKDLPLILSYNENNNLFEYKKILMAWKRENKKVLNLSFNGRYTKCTENHKFLTNNGWVEANKLNVGSLIKGFEPNCWFVIDNIYEEEKTEDVYDLEIEDNHNFILSSNDPYCKDANGPIAHNCQRTTGLAMGNALKILTTAKYGKPSKGVQVYFGTPRKKGSDFYKMWASSSQQYYYLGCSQCKQHFPLYTPGSDEWEKIWIYGHIVKCPHCGLEQDKRDAAERGKWVALRDHNEEDCKMIGFHINQLYMPAFTREDIENEKPGKHPVNTERIYNTEVLGEFFQGDSSPITPEEIAEHCADHERKFVERITPGDEQMVVLGLDYGLRADIEQLANPDKVKVAGQSYSTAVVLAVKGPNLLSIEFALKFKRNDLESKKGIIDQIMRNYSVQLAVGDIGFSQDLSEILHNIYGDKYLVSRARSKVNNYASFLKDSFPKEIIFERDYYIREIFEQMKKGQIRFPFGSYEKVAWLIEHCCSMDMKPSLSKTGADPIVHYVKGSTPNDGLMALLNGYLAYKYLVSKGFTVNGPASNYKSINDMNKPLVVGGYVSRRL